MSPACLRGARPGDFGAIVAMVRELADYERLLDQAEADEATLDAALFGPAPRVFCEIAEAGSEPAGMALWFYSFSTFRGRHGLYLEDLYVRPPHRGRGVGRALLARLAARCAAEGLARLEWAVLDWNAPAIAFYRRQGAVLLDGWTTCRVDGEALAALARA